MEGQQRSNLTVQGIGYPVPAAERGVQAGPQPSKYCDRNASVVANLATVADNTTRNNNNSEEFLQEGNPFARRCRVNRSPQGESPAEARPKTRSSAKAPKSRSERPRDPNTALCDLGQEIADLVNMLEENGGARRTIHQPMRDAIESIRALYELVAIQLHNDKAKEVIRSTQASQTSPLFRIAADQKRKQKARVQTPSTKRSKDEGNPSAAVHANENSSSSEPEVGEQSTPLRNEEGGTWKKVYRKKRKPKDMPKANSKDKLKTRLLKERPKKDAIIIAASGEQSYADILRKVKTDDKLSSFGQAVERIRKTQKGELILQLNKSGEDTSAFRELIGESLGEMASVRAMTHRVVIECRDLDEVTTSEDIREAIKNQLQISDIPQEDISLRKAYDSTQIATVRMSAECARKALNVGRLKVGWVNCRLRERVSLTRCFKCLEFGHMARQCKSEVDRSDMCRRCGLKGHIAKDCEREPQCMLCKDTQKDAKHIAGSAASALLEQTIRQRGTDVALISEPYRGRTENGWIASSCGKAALWALKTLPREVESSQLAGWQCRNHGMPTREEPGDSL
ncbi:hypothetical protein ACLKA6_012630 [Drosophila palustris]